MKKLIYLFIMSSLLIVNLKVSAQQNGYKVNRGERMEQKIDSIISQLTLEEKVAMCHAQSKFSTPGVARLGIPELWMSDGPHGVEVR